MQIIMNLIMISVVKLELLLQNLMIYDYERWRKMLLIFLLVIIKIRIKSRRIIIILILLHYLLD